MKGGVTYKNTLPKWRRDMRHLTIVLLSLAIAACEPSPPSDALAQKVG